MSLLTAREVSKRYGPVVALRSATLVVEPGEVHALLGANGAGKSTLVKVLTGVIRPDGGAILVNGVDVPDVQQQSLRAAVGIVPQDTVPFNDTIRYNIHYGRPQASEAEVVEAAPAAHIHDFIASLPAGLIGPELAEFSVAGDELALRALCARLEFFCGPDNSEVRRLIAEALDRHGRHRPASRGLAPRRPRHRGAGGRGDSDLQERRFRGAVRAGGPARDGVRGGHPRTRPCRSRCPA